MLYADINSDRQEWVYNQFINNQNLLLDWERRYGKSKYSVTCILDYAINNPDTNHLVTGHDESTNRLLLQKMVMCNIERLNPLIEKTLQNKLVLNNKSVIYFGTRSFKSKDDIELSTLLIDELGEFNENKNNFFGVFKYHPKIKLLANCTNFQSSTYDSTRRLFSKYKIPLEIDYYKSDEELTIYIRKKKIEKIKINLY